MKIGDVAADFELPDQHGIPRRLSELSAGGLLVLFFYPRAGSGGCTREACHFRDLERDFARVGAAVAGISNDAPAKQREFATENHFSYPLLSDAAGEVADQFGVRRRLLARNLPTKRTTFVLDAQLTVKFAVSSETDMFVHADQALAAIRSWNPPPSLENGPGDR
ncbi:peroxiredoxin Q/BCP [Arthrobacter silviterrae]|uniref:thioredoxin-dependent peroxiredoxin n=1 Tax=Arthrobacter silviterrae TaxID=2026658 RepID=A0ABX0D7F4_9MICC|nr:peroxiredoxin [Arthrobacter silviterrae]MDQ0276163.1 peroxiredoxin Q/BCP [Arthrobacter silviterrae]NGN82628.1 peroxiredoxin [Arthrobacter silviterrae]